MSTKFTHTLPHSGQAIEVLPLADVEASLGLDEQLAHDARRYFFNLIRPYVVTEHLDDGTTRNVSTGPALFIPKDDLDDVEYVRTHEGISTHDAIRAGCASVLRCIREDLVSPHPTTAAPAI